MKKTVLHGEHIKLGAKMVDFAGWELPVSYTSIIEEHLAARQQAALFDISHMGEILIKGESASTLLKRIIPTRLNKLEANKAMYSCLCNEEGGVIDDLFIYMVSETEFYLVVNAGNIGKDFEWILSHKPKGAEVSNISQETAKIDIQGPKAKEILKEIFKDKALDDLKRFFFFYSSFEGKRIMISNSGYTGENGYELYLNNDAAVDLWQSLLKAGTDRGLKPAGLGARDSLRIEACYALYGHELSDEISPIEAGLGWMVSSQENFIGKSPILQQKKEGACREIVTFEIKGRGIPREGYRLQKDSRDLGYVSSGIYSPWFKKGIGMGLVKSGSLKIGEQFSVIIRQKAVPAITVQKPFYMQGG